MDRETFLKNEIKKCGYNLKSFAGKIDMPYTTLLSIVNKSVGGAALDNIIKICSGLNISIETLNPYAEHYNDDLSQNYKLLNTIGKQKADEYIEDLTANPKYTEVKLNKPTAVFHTNSTDDDSAPLALQITTSKN